MFTPGSVALLREVYNWTLSDMDINDLDDQKYTLCKKLSEVRPLHMQCTPPLVPY
jgi:exportin-5